MKLEKLDETPTLQRHYIFCRGHDQGCPRHGAARDVESKGKLDLYCERWQREKET
jgi:hypothetical protein